MFSNLMIIFFVCFLIANLNTLERCPSPSTDSQDDLIWKFNASSIIAYGKATEVNGNIVTLKINCILKGQLTESTIQLNQASNVADISECHYLTVNKDYMIFIEPIKPTTSNILYRLADMEEIEITSDSLKKFMDNECSDEDDYGIPMTILYADSNNKCAKFQATCNENTKTSILNLSYPPLSKTSTFLGGLKYALPVPTMIETANGLVSGKQSVGVNDQTLRSTATVSTMFIPIIAIITSLTMVFNN